MWLWLPSSEAHFVRGCSSHSAFSPVGSFRCGKMFHFFFELDWMKGAVSFCLPLAVCVKHGKRGALSGHSACLAKPLESRWIVGAI